ncbi:peptidase S14 [Phenylobacterium kunshanense]|uniref:Peptidase S14 n=1 Tax=Phenylobacterium kunshanense TaxID=1445034 RepID=A0A328BSJ3_9CAUL|nr:peptidase S14 [Phenylobacterium kunshanense]RAK68814.1 peptidase S14 [Phenylobacterium kunshanense]
MTTIAYRDGVLASDSRAYSGDKTPIGSKQKIHRLADGTLLGVSTASIGGDALVRRWVEAGCPAARNDDLKPDSFTALMVRANGDVFYANNNLEWTGPLDVPFIAAGSGEHYALGAMAMGASAERAVEVACELDVWSAHPIRTLRLEG